MKWVTLVSVQLSEDTLPRLVISIPILQNQGGGAQPGNVGRLTMAHDGGGK